MTNQSSKWLKIITKVVFILLASINTCWAGGCVESLAAQPAEKLKTDANCVERILRELKQKTQELKSYQCRVEYLVSQPVFKSETLKKGVLYYAKSNGKSKLRINFQTLKQDDEKEQKHIVQYIFDGVWLTHIDYEIKQVNLYQQAEPNEPVDAFELASRDFPIIGFSKVEELKKEFEIKLVELEGKEQKDFIKLNLKVKPDSDYKDWPSIDFWINKKIGLPAKVIAVSTEEDIYQIELLNAKVNKRIDKKVFEFKIPKGFTVEKTPLNIGEK